MWKSTSDLLSVLDVREAAKLPYSCSDVYEGEGKVCSTAEIKHVWNI